MSFKKEDCEVEVLLPVQKGASVKSTDQDDCQFYWCGWEVPHEIPQEDMAESWPKNMKGFHTGGSFVYETYAGAVWARTIEEAMVTIWTCYAQHCTKIKMRWEPEPRGTELLSTSRFPGTYENIKVHNEFEDTEK